VDLHAGKRAESISALRPTPPRTQGQTLALRPSQLVARRWRKEGRPPPLHAWFWSLADHLAVSAVGEHTSALGRAPVCRRSDCIAHLGMRHAVGVTQALVPAAWRSVGTGCVGGRACPLRGRRFCRLGGGAGWVGTASAVEPGRGACPPHRGWGVSPRHS
jgi:hypothetical protein